MSVGWWGGTGLRRAADVEAAAYNPTVVARAIAYLRPHRRQLVVAVLLTVVSTCCSLAGPYLVKTAIDQHIATGDLSGLAMVVLATVLVYLVGYLASARQVLLVSAVGQSVLRRLRSELFQHLQRLSLAYYERTPAGVIVSRLVNDVSVMNEVLTSGLINLFTDILLLVATVAIMVTMSPRLALATFIFLPLIGVAVWVFTQRAKVAYRTTRQKMGALTAGFQEMVEGVRVVQAFARESTSRQQFDRLNQENRLANVRANTLSSGLMPVVEFTSALAVLVLVWYGGMLVTEGEVTLGVLVAFLAYISRFFQPVRELTQFYNQLQAAMAGGERVFGLLDEPVQVVEPERPRRLERVRGEVEFRDVWFAYAERPVLKGVSFRIEPGQMVALVGPTGAGKTTIASLLARFYDPTSGAVLLDGHDLRDLEFRTVRSSIALVLQDNFLFAGTIADNIRLGRPEASDREVAEAARLVGAHEFIERLERSYWAPVAERAANLSMGQRQLIALARAVLAGPRVLVLDEATSNIDPATERLVQKALQSALAGCTRLVIAHRLSTVRSAEEVLVLHDGQIVERGSHERLVRWGGIYARLYREQLATATAG